VIEPTAAERQSTKELTANDHRVRLEAMKHAEKIMSKSLNASMPNHESWLVQTLKIVFACRERRMKKQPFMFESTRKATHHNTKTLQRFGGDYKKLVSHYGGSILTPGSEFRSIQHIKPLLCHHEDWPDLEEILRNGITYPMENPLDEKTRISDLKAMIERGNHKSTKSTEHLLSLTKAYTKEVTHGWLIPLQVASLYHIKGASVIPLGVADQFSVDRNGNRMSKSRVTHDCTFPTPSGTSINSRTIEDDLSPCIYGHCLRRILHLIHMMRIENIDIIIYLLKLDLDAAYRRLHIFPDHAVMAMTVVDRRAYLEARLPFGAKSGPSQYSTMSECIFDITNDLLQDKLWDVNTLNSPLEDMFDRPTPIDTDILFAKAMPLSVPIPSRELGCDGYIDDLVTIALDKHDNIRKAQNAGPIAVHALFRPVDPHDKIPRDDAVSQRKLSGEGTPCEQKVVLGWLICTRSFQIF
jgi:hypothetical protein